jgi:phage shock protein A
MSLRALAARLVRSSVGALLAPAEDPRPGYAHAYQRQRQLLGRVRQALGELRAARERLGRRAEQLARGLPATQEQARSALLGGRTAEARAAVRRRVLAEAQAEAYARQAREIEAEEQALALIEQRLATQIESFAVRQQVLAARYSAAEAQVRIDEALSGLSRELGDLGLALEAAEESVGAMRARAQAVEDLVAGGVLPALGGPALDETRLESAVDAGLEALQAEYRRDRP